MSRLYRGRLLDDQTPLERPRLTLVPLAPDKQPRSRVPWLAIAVVTVIGAFVWFEILTRG